MAQKKEEPVKRIRLGNIVAAIWANKNEKGDVWHNVTVSRFYKDGDKWKDTSGFRRDDLPILAKVADMAYAWIWGQDVPADPNEASE
jgi:hypothetical protein